MLCVGCSCRSPLSPSEQQQQLTRKGESVHLDPLGFLFCFAAAVVVVVVYSPVERAVNREVTRLLTTLVALCVSVMKV